MPRADVVVSTPIARSVRVKQLEGMFDLTAGKKSEQKWSVNLPLEERKDWQIGLIYGPSGCGKSTIARQLFGDAIVTGYGWHDDRALIDDFSESLGIKDITQALSSVGFSSPPAWLRPFNRLSNGEQFRATVARALVEEKSPVLIDEFTSVVDRTVARIGSAAVAKAVRKQPGKQFIAVSCHDDIVDWLQPDWTYQPATGEFTWRCLQRRPEIKLRIHRAPQAAWRIFRHHHYLDAKLSPQAVCFVGFVEKRPAAFVAVINSVHPSGKIHREHRCVCLPDFQGVGIGNAMSEYVASLYVGIGSYTSVTGHPGMIAHRLRSRLWKNTKKMTQLPSKHCGIMTGKSVANNRLTAGFKYMGKPISAAIAASIRDLDFTAVVQSHPNRTIDRLVAASGATWSQMRDWLRREVVAGRVVTEGTGLGHDRKTYRLRGG